MKKIKYFMLGAVIITLGLSATLSIGSTVRNNWHMDPSICDITNTNIEDVGHELSISMLLMILIGLYMDHGKMFSISDMVHHNINVYGSSFSYAGLVVALIIDQLQKRLTVSSKLVGVDTTHGQYIKTILGNVDAISKEITEKKSINAKKMIDTICVYSITNKI